MRIVLDTDILIRANAKAKNWRENFFSSSLLQPGAAGPECQVVSMPARM